jgi:hypothetical protein
MLILITLFIIRKIKTRIRQLRLNRETSWVITGWIGLTITIIGSAVHAQPMLVEQFKRQYEVRYNGASKGKVWVIKKTEGGITSIRIESDFNFRMLVPVSVKAVEEASFTQGILTYSSVDRKVNGKQKVSQKLVAKGQTYEWTGKRNKEKPSYPITHSILSLYIQEPTGQASVFSDTHGENIPLTKIATGKYRLDLPNGNVNYYSYTDGVCTLVEIHHSFVQIQLLLKQ